MQVVARLFTSLHGFVDSTAGNLSAISLNASGGTVRIGLVIDVDRIFLSLV
jgi:hypothetical protein